MKDKKIAKSKNFWSEILKYGTVIFLIMGVIYYVVGYGSLKKVAYSEEYSAIAPTGVTSNLTEGTVIIQECIVHADYIEGVTLRFATYGDSLKAGKINVSLKNSEGLQLAKKEIPVLDLQDNEDYYVEFDKIVEIDNGEKVCLAIWESDNSDGNVATLWLGAKQKACNLYVGEKEIENTLCFVLKEVKDGHFNFLFMFSFALFFGAFLLMCMLQKRKEEKNIKSGLGECIYIFKNYRFLLKQLIGRDFAVKYRRSYLGAVWVILNPLLTMIVLSAVFSFIFRFDIENFSVYLILGQIVFNFFSEATQISITTITGSGQMIKKIYVPKYIFPLSKTMFSFFNFVLTFIPVALVMIYYKIPLTVNIVYLPLLLISYFCFTLGVSFILSALQVFLRDTQYLYGIFLTLLGYLTPIFYSITSLSPLFQKIMLINPLFHYMNVLRTILLYGMAPTVQQMSACMIIGVLFLSIGITYFYKRQKKFILYI